MLKDKLTIPEAVMKKKSYVRSCRRWMAHKLWEVCVGMSIPKPMIVRGPRIVGMIDGRESVQIAAS